MSLLAKLKLDNLTIVDPVTALSLLASRGEWGSLAGAIAAKLTDAAPGSVVKLTDIGLSPEDFKRTKASKSRKRGDIDYSGLAASLRVHGLKLKPLTDETRGIYVPSNRAEIIDAVKASKAKAAAKAKAKAAANR